MRWCGLLLALLAAPTGLAEAAPEAVARPGVVMVDPAVRRAVLLGQPVSRTERLCGRQPVDRGWPRHGPVVNVTADEQPGQTLAETMMLASAVHLSAADGDVRHWARRAVIHNLRYWAKHDALTRIKQPVDANNFYNLDRTLLPVIVGYALVRDDPDNKADDLADIDGWLARLMTVHHDQRDVDPTRISARNNHSYLRASVTMAWGALSGNQDAFGEGVSTYRRALGQLDDAGGLPLEIERGERSLFYHRHALASLVAIAEIAAAQGHALYDETNERGQSLHDLVDFLAAGLLAGPQGQDLSFLFERGHNRHYMAWFEAYRARFPDRPATLAIEATLDRAGTFTPPLFDDYSGAVTSCLFRRLPS